MILSFKGYLYAYNSSAKNFLRLQMYSEGGNGK